MNAKSKIVLLIFFFLFVACQKENQNGNFKKAVTEALKNIDSSALKNEGKEKIIDTLYNYLSKHKNDSIKRNLLFKVANA